MSKSCFLLSRWLSMLFMFKLKKGLCFIFKLQTKLTNLIELTEPVFIYFFLICLLFYMSITFDIWPHSLTQLIEIVNLLTKTNYK